MSHAVPMRLCPYCSAPNDRATDIENKAKPEPGDFTLCFNCGELMRFADDMTLVKTTDDEASRNVPPDLFVQMCLYRALFRLRGPLPRRETKQ